MRERDLKAPRKGLVVKGGLALLAGVYGVAATLCVVGACTRDEASAVQRQERRQFHIVMESKLRQLDLGIARLVRETPPIDSVFAGEVQDLERSQQSLREKLVAMNTVSDQEWPALKDALEVDYRTVRDRYGDMTMREARAASAHVDSSGMRASSQTN